MQLSQFPNNYRYLSDIMLPNSKAKSGYSQIDHLLITPFGYFLLWRPKTILGKFEGEGKINNGL
nr:nuclease-related domain-containing protein [Bacillus coahuilensis]